MDNLSKLTVHECKMSSGISVDPSNNNPKLYGERLYINEEELVKHKLHLNHYAIQSLKWFMEVKMTRGDVIWQKNVRNFEYFKKYNKNSGYEDLILCNKKYKD